MNGQKPQLNKTFNLRKINASRWKKKVKSKVSKTFKALKTQKSLLPSIEKKFLQNERRPKGYKKNLKNFLAEGCHYSVKEFKDNPIPTM